MKTSKINLKNFYIFSVIFIILTSTCFPILNEKVIGKNNSSLLNDKCYGFIIPLPLSNEISENPDIQYSTMNLINDLLRLNATVYWSKKPISLQTKKFLENSIIKNEEFPQGCFIVTFNDNEILDKKIIAAINDYNATHEIHRNTTMPVNISMILQPIRLEDSIKLIEPKIAYYYGDGVYSRSLDWYVYTLYKSGFLNNEFLYDDEIIQYLNYDDYNVFVWPGGEIIEDINSDIDIITRILKQNKIRNFVSNGGGYVGSCYGAFAASSGIKFLPFTLLNYYIPIIPSVGYLSIQDCTTALAISCTINISVSDIDHPVIYGSDEILYDSQLRGGAVFTWLGKNTQSLAKVEEVNSTFWTHWFRDLFSSNTTLSNKIIELWVKFTNQKTVWTTSKYKNGKVVTFGDHPELGHINLKRIVHNSIFYVSSETTISKKLENSYNLSDVETIRLKTEDIEITEHKSDLFTDIYNEINHNMNYFNKYYNESSFFYHKIIEMIETNEMNISFAIQIFVSGLWEFFSSMNRSKNYLKNKINDENAINYLKKIDSIFTNMNSDILTIDEKISKLKNEITYNIKNTTEINEIINENLTILMDHINNYEKSDIQNESILNLCDNLWDHQKTINRYCSAILFDSLKILRETWYTYESI